MRLLIFIPCFNEAELLISVVDRIPNVIEGISSTEILVIDDGSTDKTYEIAKQDDRLLVLRNVRNQGIAKTFQVGIAYAVEHGFDICVNIDGDGQFSPEQITEMVKPILQDKADWVAGSRFRRLDGTLVERPRHMSLEKYLGNRLGAWILSKMYREGFSDVTCGFRAYSRQAMLKMNLNSRFTYTQESFQVLVRSGMLVKQVPVEIVYHEDRKSRVVTTVSAYIARSAVGILRTFRDHNPLKFFGWFGALFFIPGLLLDLFLLIHYFIEGRFSPYIFVGFAGAYMKMLGMIVWIVGFVADMNLENRLNQEKILFLLKEQQAKK